jgi:hypothetical protein
MVPNYLLPQVHSLYSLKNQIIEHKERNNNLNQREAIEPLTPRNSRKSELTSGNFSHPNQK